MAQHVGADRLHVLGRHVAAVAQERVRAGGEGERDRGAGAGAVFDEPGQVFQPLLRRLARREHDVDHVVLHAIIHVDVTHHVARLHDLFDAGDRFDLRRHRAGRAIDDLPLFLPGRVADLHHHEKAIHLRFRQRIRAFLLDRILRGEDDERVRQRVAAVADRDLALLHGLEQRALHLGGGAVDLVRQHQVREDGAELRRELALLLVVDHGADEVGRKQVGRELHAGEFRGDRVAQRAHGQRLREAGDTLEQDVTAGEQADQHALDHVALTDDDLADLVGQAVDEGAFAGDELVQGTDVIHGGGRSSGGASRGKRRPGACRPRRRGDARRRSRARAGKQAGAGTYSARGGICCAPE